MTTLYKTVNCPSCNQDYLYITLNKTTKQLYLSCSECEASWNHPDDVSDDKKMFVDLTIDATDPSQNDVIRAGWVKYVTGTLEV
jgi:transcription elongation factor Elf1